MIEEFISIIVPIYNIRPYIWMCVDSIIRQTYKNIEIILVDDGSTDGSGDILDYISKLDSRISVIHKENGGLVSARKAGIGSSHGKYTVYVDGDDWIDDNHIEILYKHISNSNTELVATGCIDEGTTLLNRYNSIPTGEYCGESLEKIVFSHAISYGMNEFSFGILPFLWNKIFITEKLKKYQMKVPDTISISEDVFCLYPYLLDCKKILITGDCTYHYRDRSNTMSHSVESWSSIRQRHNSLYSYLKKYNNFEIIKNQLEEYFSWNIYNNCRELFFYEDIGPYPFYKMNKVDRLVVYGCGKKGKAMAGILRKKWNVIAFTDRNGRNERIDGIPVYDLNKIIDYGFDKIIISMADLRLQREAYYTLRLYGVEDSRILMSICSSQDIKKDLTLLEERIKDSGK